MFPKNCSNCYTSSIESQDQVVCPVCGHYEIIDIRTFHPTDENMWFIL